ncbi:hypothetical protein AS156_09260 [Bradyrhizobium macuxiense]|uniref:Uncharacterized protein n=1 Tax=Bradyrhizobium macuxiense TaxID=1755647 RepID=A0A120FLV5_9BRAD|nr:hypothetical protein AS156_09260 [Bradyrhizobium macuxiense]
MSCELQKAHLDKGISRFGERTDSASPFLAKLVVHSVPAEMTAGFCQLSSWTACDVSYIAVRFSPQFAVFRKTIPRFIQQ